MNPQAIQFGKEARQLLWPWLAVTAVGLGSLIYFSRQSSVWNPMDNLLPLIFPLGFFLAVPLLAALPLGSEFQHGTFPMLLAQPVGRRELWLQKWMITLAAVLPPTILYLVAGHLLWEFGRDYWLAASWIAAGTAGAMAWTLIARSTLGGLALSSGCYWIFFFAWSYLSDHLPDNGNSSAVFRWATGILLLAYCISMVFLGRRMFLRFQTVEGALGSDALAPIARYLPQINFRCLRPRPRGPIFNLLRREIRLLRMVWLLSLFSLAAWIYLASFRFVELNDSWDRAPAIFLSVLLSFLIALLAGALSLGEEKTLGTHAWHLTLPLSASAQWLVKLFVALFVSLVCAVGIPLSVLLVRGWLAGDPYSYLGHTALWVCVLEALFTTLLAFWCSCVVKGTVRAVFGVFPMVFAMGLTFTYSSWLGLKAMQHASGFLDAILTNYDLFRLNRALIVMTNPRDEIHLGLSVIVGPLLIVGLIQSFRMFRAQREDRKSHAVRCALPLLTTLWVAGFALASFFLFGGRLQSQQREVLREVHFAVQALKTSGSTDATRIQRFKIEDLDRGYRLSDRTKHWLRDSTVLVNVKAAGETGRPPRIEWPYESAYVDSRVRGKIVRPYSATVSTGVGLECNLDFWTTDQAQWGILTEACQ